MRAAAEAGVAAADTDDLLRKSEDIAQQVFVKAYFSLKRFDQRAAFSTWLYKITVNECWDMLREKKVRPLLYESDLSEEQAQRVASAESHDGAGPDIRQRLETRQQVEQLLAGLDERDKLMLILKEVEGFSIEEIAEVLDLNANTVKVRLFRARRRVVKTARERASGDAECAAGCLSACTSVMGSEIDRSSRPG